MIFGLPAHISKITLAEKLVKQQQLDDNPQTSYRDKGGSCKAQNMSGKCEARLKGELPILYNNNIHFIKHRCTKGANQTLFTGYDETHLLSAQLRVYVWRAHLH